MMPWDSGAVHSLFGAGDTGALPGWMPNVSEGLVVLTIAGTAAVGSMVAGSARSGTGALLGGALGLGALLLIYRPTAVGS
jgi:hypothetical protein